MSDTDEDSRQDRHGRPMLIIGQDYPDVEDTTPEELRRREEEARREIAEARRRAQEEIERKRREAEREIAELERKKERELAERRRELDRTQRKLYQRESKLLRRSSSGSTQRIVPKPRPVPLREKGLRRSGWGVTLGAVGAGALLIGLLTSVPGGDEEARAQIAATDQARVQWMRSGLATDEAIALRMAGQDVPAGPDGTYDNVRLAQEAVALAEGSSLYERDVEERTEQMLAEGTSEIRALTVWSQLHDESGYAVGSWEVQRVVEDESHVGGWSYFWLATGVLALAALAVLGLLAGSWVALPALVVAATLGIAGLAVVGTADAGVRGAAAAHEQADDALDELHDQVGRDLEAAYGISSVSYAYDDDFWTRDPFYDVEIAGVDRFLDAREAVGEAGEQGDAAVNEAVVQLVATTQEVFEDQVPALEAARTQMLDTLDSARGRWGLGAGLAGLGAVAGLVGLLLSGGRRRTS